MCSIPGCSRPLSRYSNLCRFHRTMKRRRGHPQQAPITAARIKPYLKAVSLYLAGPYGARVLNAFEQVWHDFVDAGTESLRDFESGKPVFRNHHEAALELQGLSNAHEPVELLHALIAMFLLREHEPSFFQSDEAFAVMLQRFIRKKASGSYDLVWNATRQEYARKLRGLSQKAALTLGEWFVHVFAKNCGVLAREIFNEQHRHIEQEREVGDAMHELKRSWRERSPMLKPRPAVPVLPADTPDTFESLAEGLHDR